MAEGKAGSKKALMTTLAVLLVIVLLVSGVIALKKNNKKDDTSAQTDTVAPATESASSETPATGKTSVNSSSKYKDGTYTATGTYSTPGGPAKIGVAITVQGDKVIGATATSMANNDDSAEFQSEFVDNFKAQVVGKNIDNIKLSKVSGSSLTPVGFNNALDQIRTQAKA